MSSHLTSHQLDALLHHDESAETRQHLAHCALCAEELASLRSNVFHLRLATTALAEQHRLTPALVSSRTSISVRAGWAFASIILVASIAAPLAMHHSTAVRTAATSQITTHIAPQIADEALLSSIEDDLSASVPSPMLPLATTSPTSTSRNSRKN